VPVSRLLIHVSELTGADADTAPMYALSRRAFIAAGLGAMTAAMPAHAEDVDDDGNHHRNDHDRARLAVEQGEARPLADILAKVRPDLGGEVAGVTFHRRSGRWVYEFRVIGHAGQMAEVVVDATTADILKREAH
jgi:uncharacterized membrane protein YkoI